ncbi:MAG: hypothetical protein JWM59_2170 [Verrucomicrobiales bacterium]|nr:hypothetical protein [Verrucomicrobiales bacterium]
MLKKKDLISRMAAPFKEPVQEEGDPATSPAPEVVDPVENQSENETPPPKGATRNPQTSNGKPTGFRLEESDRGIFQQKCRDLDDCGVHASHNLIARASLRLVPRDHRLVEMVRELIAADGRTLRHKKP